MESQGQTPMFAGPGSQCGGASLVVKPSETGKRYMFEPTQIR